MRATEIALRVRRFEVFLFGSGAISTGVMDVEIFDQCVRYSSFAKLERRSVFHGIKQVMVPVGFVVVVVVVDVIGEVAQHHYIRTRNRRHSMAYDIFFTTSNLPSFRRGF